MSTDRTALAHFRLRLDPLARDGLAFLLRYTPGATPQVTFGQTLVRAALVEGCARLDLRGVFDRPEPARCAYCGGLVRGGKNRYCSHNCTQLAGDARRLGRDPRKIGSLLRQRGGRYPALGDLPGGRPTATPMACRRCRKSSKSH